MKSATLSVSIHCEPQKVYRFVSNPENLPVWASAFARSIEQINGEWILTTDQGPVKIRMAPENEWGILDHVVIPAPGVEIQVPMRVVARGEGSEVLFTLFQQPGMSDENFEKDKNFVSRDLKSLKQIMEK